MAAEKAAVLRARVPLSLKRQIKAIADELDESESIVIRRALKIYIAKHAKELTVDSPEDGPTKQKKKAA